MSTTTESETTTDTRSQSAYVLRELGTATESAASAATASVRRTLDGAARGAVTAARVVTPIGWVIVVTALVGLVLGVVFGWAELVFLGATAGAAFLVALFALIGRTSYDVGIGLEPRRVTAGGRAMGTMSVRNTGARPVLPTRIELPVGAGRAEFIVPRLAPGSDDEYLFAVPTHRRAVIVTGPATSVRGDQLGMVRHATAWTERIELYVHPRTVRIGSSSDGLVHDLEGRTTATLTDNDLAFHALRAYEPGDDIRNVHWRTSARTGRLMVRQYQETRRAQALLLMATERSHFASEEEFELAVSAFASVGVAIVREETPMQAWWQGGRLRDRTAVTLLDDACRVERTDARHAGLREFARTVGTFGPAPSLVVLFVGSAATSAEIGALGALYGAETKVIAVRCVANGDAALRRTGSVTVVELGRLEELVSLLERAGR